MEDEKIDFDNLSPDKVTLIGRQLDMASRCGVGTLRHRLPAEKIDELFKKAIKLLKSEPTLLELNFDDANQTVAVVGDTHGQLHDVLRMFEVAGQPGGHLTYILNGDFVDRGSWGLEVLILFVCWKLTFPDKVFLIRGNHESRSMTQIYGYKTEVEAKYSKGQNRLIYAASKKLFAVLPLGAVIQNTSLICHGGLFRTTKPRRRKEKKTLKIGDLSTLKSVGKGGPDPTVAKVSPVVSDVLWSDPSPDNGLVENESRGLGLYFGPDVTDAFLEANGLKLIIRSHEGPDARECRNDMADMMSGFAIDHDTPHGKLVTVFSAPDYPQFQEGERTNNRAAVAILRGPDYADATPIHFEAVHPRPAAPMFYEMEYAETEIDFNAIQPEQSGSMDEEFEVLYSTTERDDPAWIPEEDESD